MKASEQGVTLRDQLPSRRVAALYLPKHRLARSDKGLGCKQSGRAWSLLSSWDRAAEVHRCRIHSLPPCPSCLRAPALAVTAIHRRPLRLGRRVTQRLCSTASAHVHGTTRARRCAKGRPPLCFIPPTNPNPSPHPSPSPSPSLSPSPSFSPNPSPRHKPGPTPSPNPKEKSLTRRAASRASADAASAVAASTCYPSRGWVVRIGLGLGVGLGLG